MKKVIIATLAIGLMGLFADNPNPWDKAGKDIKDTAKEAKDNAKEAAKDTKQDIKDTKKAKKERDDKRQAEKDAAK